MDAHTKLLEGKEFEIDAKLKKLYEGFDSEWAERMERIKEIDEHLKVHNSVEIVRHIKANYLAKINKHKLEAEGYLHDKNSDLSNCKDSICKAKAQKLIDWVTKNISNLESIIEFFQEKMQEYMSKGDIKIIDGEGDDEEDDEVMKSDKKNQAASIRLMKEFNGGDDENDDEKINPINFEGSLESEDMVEYEDYEESVIPRSSN